MQDAKDNKKRLNATELVPSRRFFLMGSAAIMFSTLTISNALADAGFIRWIENFRKIATANGISTATFNLAFKGVDAPDPDVLQKANHQPEFKENIWSYFDNRVNEDAVARGRIEAKKWQKWLSIIEKKFGIDPSILLAIWSMETNYGEVLQRADIIKDAIRSLSTLAYADQRRSKFANSQLLASLKILQRGDIVRNQLSGSWAGAMGHTQFIPTSYMAYAVDIDGDNRRDIWNSIPDALASAANLLRKNGWQAGRSWGYEIILPNNRNKLPSGSQTLSQWQNLGVRRANGQAFPNTSTSATLKLLQGRDGPTFLVMKNFNVLKRYNNADRYALAVGLLADEIAGYGGLRKDWSRPYTAVSMQERKEIQKHLLFLGYYDEKIDGKIGSGSIKAIQNFESKNGLKVTGYPSRELLNALRKR